MYIQPIALTHALERDYYTICDTMATVISIKYGDIPAYLHESDFYNSLTCENPNDEFEVPAKCFVKEDTVKTIDQFTAMLPVIAFWGLNKIPSEFIQFCIDSDQSILKSALQSADVEKKLGEDLVEIFSANSQEYLLRAMKLRRTEFVNYFIEFKPETIVANAICVAAEVGRVDYVKLLRAKSQAWDKTLCAKAAAGGHLDCLKYLHTNGCVLDKYTILFAARGGHLNCLQYAYDQGVVWTANDPYTFDFANPDNPLEAATRAGHVDCLRYLLSKDSVLSRERLCGEACKFGHLPVLKLLHEHQAPWDDGAAFMAAVHKHLDCLKYLAENGCPFGEEIVGHAASTGSMEILQYVVELGHRGNSETLCRAMMAEHNSFACVRYLIEGQYVPVREEDGLFHMVFLRAVITGNPELVRFLGALGSNINKPDPHVEMYLQHFYHIVLQKKSLEEFPAFDKQLQESIAAAVALGWEVARYGRELIQFVRHSSHLFPVSATYLCELVPPGPNVPRGF